MSILIEGDRLRLDFKRFDAEEYSVFLKAKGLPESSTTFNEPDESYTITCPARFAGVFGLDPTAHRSQALGISPFLFDDQKAITQMALDAKRFACWSACGTGKTLIGLEFARHVINRTGQRALITTVNEVVPQWVEEAAKFYGDSLPIHRITSRAEMKAWLAGGSGMLGVVNYEKWNPETLAEQVVTEAKHLGAIILDEASRLKAGGGKQKWALIKSCRGIEYKLTLTATPAPNELMEYASQASFLEKMRDEGEIIWTFFRRDEKTHRWTVRPHAREAFFKFMAGWSIYVNDPKAYGWRQDLPDVPEPQILVHEIEPTEEQIAFRQQFSGEPNGQLLLFGSKDTNAIQRAKMSQVAKGFRYFKGAAGEKKSGSRRFKIFPSRKPAFVADLVRGEVKLGHQVLLWTIFDAESTILNDLLVARNTHSVELLTGSTKEEDRLGILQRFKAGQSRVLISRASMLGFGMNFQCCTSMVFSGFNDSYEQLYQAIRRAYRHGQAQSVRVYVPVIHELEGDMWDNLCRKESRHLESIREMEANYIKARRELRVA